MIKNEIITLVSFYDTYENKDNYLKNIENLLRQIDVQQGIIIGADFNKFTDNLRDQKGNQARPHYCTKATVFDSKKLLFTTTGEKTHFSGYIQIQ